MPLIRMIEGQTNPYEPIFPIHPADPSFSAVLASQMSAQDRKGVTSKHKKKLAPSIKTYQQVAHEGEADRKPALQARDLMSKSIFTLPSTDTLLHAHDLMEKHQIRHLPILDKEGGTLIGMLSDRDILRASPDLSQLISSKMSTHLLTATMDTPIAEIANALLTHRTHSLPVIGSDRKILGILTTTDILRALVKRAPLELWV